MQMDKFGSLPYNIQKLKMDQKPKLIQLCKV